MKLNLGKLDNEKLIEICSSYFIKEKENIEIVKRIAPILKDADALDRSRFPIENNLNITMLRTKGAKIPDIITFSKVINNLYAGCILKENYPNATLGDSNVKTLYLFRRNYKLENNGIRKIENDISTGIVKKLFSNSFKFIRNKLKYDNNLEI